ncbi:flagellar biosynthetic protein FliO, partial [Nitratireductor sp. GCM10026969]|uniref:flagellar biosynthetic protein FliO n=1 Tax=Nitratireductor sp. GCM10026969 TaxID=3252645 RepID=UPI003622FB31
MNEWLSGLAGETVARAFLWTLAALALLVVVLVAIRLLRGRGRGTFIAGGRNRLPRLAVVDAVAVDSQRRLVLVRRDDIEHLILIGGSNDVVVEPQIRMRDTGTAQQRPRQNAPAPILPRRPAAPAP